MDPLTFSLIMMGATVGSTALQGWFQSNEMDKQRSEAKNLADIQRQDTLKEQNRNNQLATNKSNMNKENLDFSKNMLNEQVKDQDTSKNYFLNQSQQNDIGNTSKNLFDNKDSWMMKSRLLARI
jgi:hypothetical protein